MLLFSVKPQLADAALQHATSVHKQEDKVGSNKASPKGSTHVRHTDSMIIVFFFLSFGLVPSCLASNLSILLLICSLFFKCTNKDVFATHQHGSEKATISE